MSGDEGAYSEEEFVEEDDASSTRSITPAAQSLGAAAEEENDPPSGKHTGAQVAASPQASRGSPGRDPTPPVSQTGAEVSAVLGGSPQGSHSSGAPPPPESTGVASPAAGTTSTPGEDAAEATENANLESTGNRRSTYIGSVPKHASMPSLVLPVAVGTDDEAQAKPGVQRPGSAPSLISLELLPSVREQVAEVVGDVVEGIAGAVAARMAGLFPLVL